MLRISIEPRNIEGYTSYFEPISSICCGKGYTVIFEAYVIWATKIMTISRLRFIRFAYHTEFRESAVGDKCHQMRFLVWCITQAAAITFDLGLNAVFYEGGIENCSFFCCVCKYYKDKMEKSRIYFFVLADSKYYFVWYIAA